MKEVIRVHKIATLAWCQVKAQAMLQNKFVEKETEAMSIGKFWHDKLGFNEEIEYRKEFRVFIIEGHIDRLLPHASGELNIYDGRYPLRFLLAYAHSQANLYCWLTGKEAYIIFVAIPKRRKVLTYPEVYNQNKAYRDLILAYHLKLNNLPPRPTRYKWKCLTCGFEKECRYSALKSLV